MTDRDLLVRLDDSTGCGKRVDAAVRLARQHDAHLTGVYPIVEIPLLHYIRRRIPREVQASMDAEAQAAGGDRAQGLSGGCRAWRRPLRDRTDHALDTTLADVLSMQARYADLVVLGQVNPDEPTYAAHHVLEEIVLSSGRPALIVPYDCALDTFPERVLIAWDASREAARAVSDAMPILQQATPVLVVSINPRSESFGHGELPGADIARHLARHNIKVEVQSVEKDAGDVGEALLSFAADSECDLLVMGAYAHARIRELVLGGATRTILKKLTLPLLMAH